MADGHISYNVKQFDSRDPLEYLRDFAYNYEMH